MVQHTVWQRKLLPHRLPRGFRGDTNSELPVQLTLPSVECAGENELYELLVEQNFLDGGDFRRRCSLLVFRFFFLF